MWTSVGCHNFFGNFCSVFTFSHIDFPVLATCLPASQKKLSQTKEHLLQLTRDSPSDTALPAEDEISLPQGPSEKGCKGLPRMS